MAQSNEGLTTDNVIFNIEDYVGGNIEGVEQIDRMGFTVFLRNQLESYRIVDNFNKGRSDDNENI